MDKRFSPHRVPLFVFAAFFVGSAFSQTNGFPDELSSAIENATLRVSGQTDPASIPEHAVASAFVDRIDELIQSDFGGLLMESDRALLLALKQNQSDLQSVYAQESEAVLGEICVAVARDEVDSGAFYGKLSQLEAANERRIRDAHRATINGLSSGARATVRSFMDLSVVPGIHYSNTDFRALAAQYRNQFNEQFRFVCGVRRGDPEYNQAARKARSDAFESASDLE